MPKTKMRGLTTVEALLIAAAFIIVGVVGLLTFQAWAKPRPKASEPTP
jgi:Tfp pilus assembly protein PilV